MAPITNGRLLLNSYPKNYPIPGETTVYDDTETIDLDNVDLGGGILLKVIYLSADPYLRNRMAPGGFSLNQPIVGYGISRIVRSDASCLEKGDIVYGFFPWKQYAVIPAAGFKDFRLQDSRLRVINNDAGISLSAYIGAAGMPGKTAYYGWREHSKVKPGETVFVTTGAGAVGTVIIQLAKSAGCNVIASAGSADKVARMKEIGVDVAFNYKEVDTKSVLEKEGPVDIYWDHVGGATLDTVLEYANDGARFIEVGMISGYNDDGENYGVKNLFQLIARKINMIGFQVSTLESKYVDEFYQVIPSKIANCEIKVFEERTNGLDRAGHVLEDVQRGRNTAKSVIVVAEED